MAHRARRRGKSRFPPIQPGHWHGEIFPGGSVTLGQTVQDGPPRQSVEFSYITLPASLHTAVNNFCWPAVIMIVTPTPMKLLQTDAGLLLKNNLAASLMLSLDVTRCQFSDMLRLLQEGRLKHLHFTIEPPTGLTSNQWRVRSWGMKAAIENASRNA